MSKGIVRTLLAVVTVVLVTNAGARDTRNMYSISEAMKTADAIAQLDKNIRLYFGRQGHPAVVKRFGEFMTNKKTNAFNKTDERACQWVFLSAMLQLQERAKSEGGNAVINIRSYYKKNEISSTTEFECGSGFLIAGVTFLGDVVKLR